MIDCANFYNLLIKQELEFFVGVPDSLLRDICAYISDNSSPTKHVIAANEGNAVALACGYHLSTKKIGVVYMQNSGLGNAVNPLLSLADSEVYNLPLLLLIGWRGEPGTKDEPQHLKQGKVTLPLLKTLGIEHEVLPKDFAAATTLIKKAVAYMNKTLKPFALVVQRETFEKYNSKQSDEVGNISREEAIKSIINKLDANALVISTTGKTSRELFELRETLKQGHAADFLTVGSMGHASQIAAALALNADKRQVYCLDGDGAALMHMGALAINGSLKINNFKHIILNNGVHDSVGGQPTVGFNVDFPAVAQACGYKNAWRAETLDEINKKMALLNSSDGPVLLEIRVRGGARKNLGRPTTLPQQNKQAFMENINAG